MKSLSIKKGSLLAVACFLFPIYSQGQEVTIKSDSLNEISREFTIPIEATLSIKNQYRTIEIEEWNKPQVKVVIRTDLKLADKQSAAELSTKLGLSIKKEEGGILLESNYQKDVPDRALNKDPEAGKAPLIVRVPRGQKLEIENTYGNIRILTAIKQVSLKLRNSLLEAKDIGHLILDSKQSDCYAGNISSAEITFSNGNFQAKNIGDLSIYSETSTIIADDVEKAVVKSTNDYYELSEVGTLECVKSFNSLLIDKLVSYVQIDGSSADIRIREFSPAVTSVNIKNRYCSLRLSIADMEDYSLTFEGMYTTVFGDFERKEIPVNHQIEHYPVPIKGMRVKSSPSRAMPDTVTAKKEQLPQRPKETGQRADPFKFIASKGDGTGTHINVECYNCRVDFN